MRYLVLLLAFSLALPAGAQHKIPRRRPAAPAKTTAAAKQAPAPVLVFQRTPCNGRCPAYTATIFADGRVEYDGQRYVTLLGRHTLALPAATVAQLLAEARRIHFEQLRARYSNNTSDLPATIITVRQRGAAARAVYADEDIPANLQGYITYLQGKLDPLAGMGTTE